MIRKTLLSTVLALTALTGLSVTPADAFANSPGQEVQHRRRHVHYEVLYRHRNHWDSHGTFHSRHAAEQAAERLRCQGYAVRIVREIVR